MIINVQFQNKQTCAFSGRPYSYLCTIRNVAVGDIVIAPTQRGSSEARVCAVNIPMAAVAPPVRPLLKTITERKDESADGK